MNCKAPMPMTEFDMATLDDSTQMMKAIIPYLSFPMQKSMAVMVRIKELTDTIRCYNQGRVFPDKSGAGQAEMLSALGRYCSPDIQNNINMMNQMMQFSNAMNLYKDMEQSPEFMNIINMMNEAGSQTNNTTYAGEDITNAAGDTDSTNISDAAGNTNAADTANDSNAAGIMNTMNNQSPDAVLQGMMNDEQMEMYNDYLNEIDEIFSKTGNAAAPDIIQEPAYDVQSPYDTYEGTGTLNNNSESI